jgi:Gas vesicle protein K
MTAPRRKGPKKRPRRAAMTATPTKLGAKDLERLQKRLARELDGKKTRRWNSDPEDAQRSVARLVLSLVEFLRKLMERQAIRRMDAGTLDDREVERVGMALMRLEETVHELARRFKIPPEELNLDLGPLGRLS